MSLYRLDGDAEFVMGGFAAHAKRQHAPRLVNAVADDPSDSLADLDPMTAWSSMDDSSVTLVTSAVQLIPGAEAANLCSFGSLLSGPQLRVVAGTSLALRELEDLQVDCDEGPSILSARTNEIVTSSDLTGDDRWPEFARQAAPLNASSVLTVPLVVGSGLLGVLSVYAAEVAVFTERAVEVACAFAAPAALVVRDALALDHARFLAAQARAAAADRRLVERAIALHRSLSDPVQAAHWAPDSA